MKQMTTIGFAVLLLAGSAAADNTTSTTAFSKTAVANDPDSCSQDTSMVFVEGGTFMMGDTWGDGLDDEKPTHQVSLDSFEISQYEITKAELGRVMQWAAENKKIKFDHSHPTGFKKV